MQSDKLLVTGGAGFIGANLVRHLLQHSAASLVVLDKLSYAGHRESLAELDGSVMLSPDEDAMRVECTLDEGPIDCDLSGFDFELFGGMHKATAQAFDAGDNGGQIASVTWEVDAAPPQVSDIDIADTGPGSARVQFILSDVGGVASVRCRIDGGAFTVCGASAFGEITYTQLTPGLHVVEIYGIDVFDTAGLTAESQPPPASFARQSFNHSSGTGHLVVIGNDYSVPPIIPGKPQQLVTDFEQILHNAVAQAPGAGFSRGPRILAVTENTFRDELGHVRQVLDDAFPLYTFQEIDVNQTASALARGGFDLLMILDQNDSFFTVEQAAAIAPAVGAFLASGGTVVLNSGTYDDDGDHPSGTFTLLDPSLLSLSDASDDFLGGDLDVPCNEEDPLLLDVAQFRVNIPSGSVWFQTPEPWVVFAEQNEGSDQIVVLHKWFGPTNLGPIGISGGSGSGDDVYFQDADGGSRAHCRTLSNGTAVHQMDPNGYVSLGTAGGGDTLPALISFVAVDPLTHLDLRSPPNSLQEPIGSVEVDLPSFGGASSYRVVVGCGEGSSESLNITASIYCLNPDLTYNIAAEAHGSGGALLAYSVLTGQTQLGGGKVAMGAWQTPNLSPSISLGGLDAVLNVTMSASLSVGVLDYQEDTGTDITPPDAPNFSFYSVAGGGPRPFDHFNYEIGVRFVQNVGDQMLAQSVKAVRGPVLSSLAVNLAQVLLPRLDEPDLNFDPTERMTATWTADGSLAGSDFGALIVSWSADQQGHQWLLVFPPGTSVQAPPIPEVDGAAFYWPTGGNEPQAALLAIEAASFVASYDQVLNGLPLLFGRSPPTGTFDWRVTQLARSRIVNLASGPAR